ncbi:MAG: glycosyltransferase family 9 protein [Paludibacteraceae bacterium]|nr:glycosyltransferase family 9 protein [Paludibacteraceae bacterium]
MKHEHILIIRFSAMGDVAMAVPVVYSLATQYPNLRITVLSRKFARPLFEDLAPNVDFMEADLKGEYRGVKGLNALYRRLTAKQFTKIADLHNVLRSEYLRMRFNIGRYHVEHINKHRRQRRALVSYNNKVRKQLPTPFENYAEVLAKLGYPIRLEFHSIFPPEGGNLNLLPAIIGPKKSFQKWIGVAPTAAHAGKCYPTPLMRQVVEQLIQNNPQSRIFLFGRGHTENLLFTEWCQDMPQCVYVSQYLENLHQELILMSHLDVMLSMDSANMHLASLTATPVVSVWGATHPYAGFVGWNQPQENIIQADLDCRPCSIYGKRPCRRGDMACMYMIKPEQIVKRIEQIL